ncbi:hypothetical protein Theth_1599 [Pseudothermotoga thermarum DSM 5069]|uniref:Uncharacterized protein n=1 Tax=Pseudothermotoga thermarum DSM 5069 TaxID=688269 RepID=F7YVJ6_9THEM|nr:hypothetical protein Theth_1599 [Pseudothermotoga thermarum DSM 5069]
MSRKVVTPLSLEETLTILRKEKSYLIETFGVSEIGV